MFERLPGGIHTIWLNRDFRELEGKIEKRRTLAEGLEKAETVLIKKCHQNELKRAKQEGREPRTQQWTEGGVSTGAHTETTHGAQDISSSQKPQVAISSLDGAYELEPSSERPGRSRPPLEMEMEDEYEENLRSRHGLSLAWYTIRHFFGNDSELFVKSPQPQRENTDGFPFVSPADTTKDYPEAFRAEVDEDQDGDAQWRRFISPTDRQTMRLPVCSWLPALPAIGQKVDRIYWHRRELARLNVEIETDQSKAEDYPLMNSAFIQFNSQAAAHLCCQSLMHHGASAMTRRVVEISPDDVIWENMAMSWWSRYLRTCLTTIAAAVLIVAYAIPVAFTGLLSNIAVLADVVYWLAWLNGTPGIVKSAIQGLLPQLILILILLVVPVIFRILIHQQGAPTGNAKEKGVQAWFFPFLFIQVFFVVTLSSGIVPFTQMLSQNPTRIFSSLAISVPPAANYFFSYLTVQALNNSAMNLFQPFALITMLVLAPLTDTTAREKWKRQTEPNIVVWGSFFPPFTNFAAIGIIYSVPSPLILVFMLLIFGLFSIVYRYNILFVYRSRNDTGGLLFPTAINQLFTGVYLLEICLIGLFFAIRSVDGNNKLTKVFLCIPQGVIMVLVLAATILWHYQLNRTFDPLFHYLPLSLEDVDAVKDRQWASADRHTRERTDSAHTPLEGNGAVRDQPLAKSDRHPRGYADIERQRAPAKMLYADVPDDLAALTPEEREAAVRTAFQPAALRATRPVVWIPRDSLGVSDDEIKRAQEMSTVKEKTHIWMSNEASTLDEKGHATFSSPPPDFGWKDQIEL